MKGRHWLSNRLPLVSSFMVPAQSRNLHFIRMYSTVHSFAVEFVLSYIPYYAQYYYSGKWQREKISAILNLRVHTVSEGRILSSILYNVIAYIGL